MNNEKITAYKGFNNDLTCRGYQYEVGKEYEMDGNIEVCERGFHACESPLEVLGYYFLDENADLARFCEVEQSGKIKRESESTKVASSRIKIKAELKFADFIKLCVEWLKEKTSPEKVDDKIVTDDCDYSKIGSSGNSAQIGSSGYSAKIGSSGNYAQIGSSGNSAKIGSSGDYSQIGSSGNYAQIGSSGDYSQIGSSGYSAQIGSSGYSAKIGSSGNYAQIGSSGNYAQIGSSGESSVICCAGHNSVVRAKKGSWITLAEWMYSDENKRYVPKCVKTELVDGERIKENTWYKLVNGEFVEQ